MKLLHAWNRTLYHRQTHFTYKSNWQRLHLDPFLVGALFTLIATGLIILYSASNRNLNVMMQQMLRIGFASVILFICAQIPPEKYRNSALGFFITSVLLLITVLIIGKIGKGAQRW